VGDDFDFWVVEVSSYQATMLQVGPPVVAVTSLSPDHLPWHRGSVETYYRDKLSICALPGVRVSVANGASVELRAHANLLGRTVKWVEDRDVERESWVRALPLVGRHNQRNAVLAATMLREAGIQKATDFAALHEAVGRFAPLAHRLTTIGIVNGVRFVDDSLATNVLPTIAALESFPVERVALIVGGQDRGIDYRPLGTHIRDHGSEVLVLAVPESGERIASEVSEALVGTRSLVRRCADLREAVAAGFHWARPDGVVLLSPAAPSFGAFRDYAQRSEVFAEAMSELPGDR